MARKLSVDLTPAQCALLVQIDQAGERGANHLYVDLRSLPVLERLQLVVVRHVDDYWGRRVFLTSRGRTAVRVISEQRQ